MTITVDFHILKLLSQDTEDRFSKRTENLATDGGFGEVMGVSSSHSILRFALPRRQ
jgi:hypothetical protein